MDHAHHVAGPGLATADDCDDGEEVSRVRLRYPTHLMSCTITLAHTLAPSHTVRCLDHSTAGDCIRRAVLSGLRLRYQKHPEWACMRARGYGQAPSADETSTAAGKCRVRIAGERASARRPASATYLHIKHPGGTMGGPWRVPRPHDPTSLRQGRSCAETLRAWRKVASAGDQRLLPGAGNKRLVYYLMVKQNPPDNTQ